VREETSYLTISRWGENWFVYGNHGHIDVNDHSLEHALIKAIQQAGIEGVELAPTLQAAEVLESLLGAKS
jgi:hypothetical protein